MRINSYRVRRCNIIAVESLTISLRIDQKHELYYVEIKPNQENISTIKSWKTALESEVRKLSDILMMMIIIHVRKVQRFL